MVYLVCKTPIVHRMSVVGTTLSYVCCADEDEANGIAQKYLEPYYTKPQYYVCSQEEFDSVANKSSHNGMILEWREFKIINNRAIPVN